MNLPPIEERLRSLLRLTAKVQKPCRACGVTLFFIQHANGKLAPYTEDGVNHFATCPKAQQFKAAAAGGAA